MRSNRMIALCAEIEKNIDLMESIGGWQTPVNNKVLRTLIEIVRREAARKAAK